MNLKQLEQEIYNKASIKKRILLTFWGIFYGIEHHFRRITKICPHDSTFGPLLTEESLCLDCGRLISKNNKC
jgi:hypothetical protein